MLEWILLGLFLVIGLVIVLYIWGTYNKFITLSERIKNAWAQIDVQLKRRYDLIPNLMETVKGYAKHEKKIFTDVAKYRGGLVQGNPAERAEADALLSSALGRLLAVAENYPKLRANENFLKLQEELTGTEDKISYVRTAYNDYVLQYNKNTKLFPAALIANIFNFREKEYFKPPEEHRKVVKVKFD